MKNITRVSEEVTSQNLQNTDNRSRELEISFGSIVKIIFRRKYGIILIVFFSLFNAWINYKQETPAYYAPSLLMINPRGGGDMQSAFLGQGAFGLDATKKDIALLHSPSMAEQAVRGLFNSGRKDSLEFFGKRSYISPMAQLIKKLKRQESLKPPGLATLTDDDLYYYTLNMQGRIRVEPIEETNLIRVSVASPFPDEAVYLTNMLCRVYKESDVRWNSEKFAQSNKFIADLLQEQQKKVDAADNALSDYMQHNEIFDVSGNTGTLFARVTDADARYNDVMVEYNIAHNGLSFIEKKLTATDKALSLRIAQNINAQLGAIQDEMRASESDYIRLLQQKGGDDVEVKAKLQRLDIVKARYEQLSRSKIAGEITSAGRSQKFSFDLVAEKLQTERKLNNLEFTAKELMRLKKYYESMLGEMPKKQLNYAKLQSNREVVGKTYIFLKEKQEETRMLLGSEVGSVSIVGTAFRPLGPESPNLSKMLLKGLLMGGAFAFMFTLIAELLDDTIKDDSFFKDLNFTILSVIPLVVGTAKNSFTDTVKSRITRMFYWMSKVFPGQIFAKAQAESIKTDQKKTAKAPMPKITDSLSSEFAESFRTLRTSLEYSRIENPLTSILVSGTAMSEGKSTACANLAMAFALIGKKTLIIDCDLRRASVHKKFNVKRQPGLTEYLFSQSHSIDDEYFQPTHIDNLFVLSAGKMVPNPNELLGSAKMVELLKVLEGKFDKVLLDSPPLFLSDAAQLAKFVDGIILAARVGYTNRKPLEEFASDKFLRPLMLGVVIIAPRHQGHYGYGKYGYGNYGYGKYGYRYRYESNEEEQ